MMSLPYLVNAAGLEAVSNVQEWLTHGVQDVIKVGSVPVNKVALHGCSGVRVFAAIQNKLSVHKC